MDGRPPRRGWVRKALLGVGFIAYPLLVWYGLTRWSTRTVALAMLAVLVPLAAFNLARRDRAARGLAVVPLVTIVALALGAALDAAGFVLAVPVAINAVMLVVFGATLRAGALPMIERFARLVEPELPPEKQHWCRLWTRVWCVFFVVNGSIALVLALAAPVAWWVTWNGLLAYVLMGILFVSEWVGRRLRFGRGESAGDSARAGTRG